MRIWNCGRGNSTARKAIPGTEKRVTIRMGYEITERTMDRNGQFLLVPDIEANTWWTNTDFTDSDVIVHYHAHGECEQFHSELKTDMERGIKLSGPKLGKAGKNRMKEIRQELKETGLACGEPIRRWDRLFSKP